mmetsp:Transcript_12871/g.35668  ORF Transcript_12871/g.35668 Transcript_12871/m.35668 type:complete len:182 (+) Transcript_12871:189-734(+)
MMTTSLCLMNSSNCNTQKRDRANSLQTRFGLPSTEILLYAYSCSLNSNNPVPQYGTLYVFPSRLGFACDIIGYTTTVTICFGEILAVKKAKTLGVLHNSIEIRTRNKVHTFSYFASRNEAFHIIKDLWSVSTAILRIQAEHASPQCKQAMSSSDQERRNSIFLQQLEEDCQRDEDSPATPR